MLGADNRSPRKVGDVVGQATGLRALSAVGRASCERRRKIAFARIAHAQGAGNEKLDAGARHRLADGRDFVERQFAGRHDLCESQTVEKGRFFRRADVALGGRVNFDVGKLSLEQPQILYDQGVDSGLFGLPGGVDCLIELVVVDERIERHVDAGSILMRKLGDAGEILKGVACGLPCTECGPADVDGVGTVQDRGTSRFKVSCGRKEFKRSKGTHGRGAFEH